MHGMPVEAHAIPKLPLQRLPEVVAQSRALRSIGAEIVRKHAGLHRDLPRASALSVPDAAAAASWPAPWMNDSSFTPLRSIEQNANAFRGIDFVPRNGEQIDAEFR